MIRASSKTVHRTARETQRFLGIELSGAKNQKTAFAAIEYYPREGKIFLLDLFEKLVQAEGQSNDDALLEMIEEFQPDIRAIGVHGALNLPPCIQCTRKSCPTPANCTVPSVKWMRETIKRSSKKHTQEIRVRDFTPYTQRPFEIWARYHLLPRLPEAFRFEIDETLGGNRAPLSARMHFLKYHLRKEVLFEVWPKLTMAVLARELELSAAAWTGYRQLEEGTQLREKILKALVEKRGLFIYERDRIKAAQHLNCFDALICAFTALLAHLGVAAKAPHGFPSQDTFVVYPSLDRSDS